MSKLSLDPQQDQCVHTDKNHVIVIAGAGSGKTRVLTERFKYLLESGVPACNIVAITFTNMAAEEMRERLQDVPGASEAFIGTIHSFANRLMKDSGEKYSLYTKDINLQYHYYLILRYCRHLTMDKYIEYVTALDEVDVGKRSEESLHDILSNDEFHELTLLHRTSEQVEKDFKEYRGPADQAPPPDSIETLCKRNNVITFDELIRRADQYFRSLGASIDHLLVDEFQDVGHLEFRFFEGLNATNTFYVGDDYQSIYGFKGGDVNIFKKLVADPTYTTYYLTNNYRNCQEVLGVANTVIRQVPYRIDKTVVNKSGEKGTVVFDSKASLKKILLSIDPRMYGKYFILVRSNKELNDIVMNVLTPMGIPRVTFKREGMKLSEMRELMESNAVKVLTVHTAKGLESDNVILYGNFPLTIPSYIRNASDERKVMYVGVTRARHKLYILT